MRVTESDHATARDEIRRICRLERRIADRTRATLRQAGPFSLEPTPVPKAASRIGLSNRPEGGAIVAMPNPQGLTTPAVHSNAGEPARLPHAGMMPATGPIVTQRCADGTPVESLPLAAFPREAQVVSSALIRMPAVIPIVTARPEPRPCRSGLPRAHHQVQARRPAKEQPAERADATAGSPALVPFAGVEPPGPAAPDPMPVALSALDAPLLEALERIVSFAALGRTAAGEPQMTLGLMLSQQMPVRLTITATGQRRIVLRASSRGAGELDEPIAALVEGLRRRGIEVEDVVLAS